MKSTQVTTPSNTVSDTTSLQQTDAGVKEATAWYNLRGYLRVLLAAKNMLIIYVYTCFVLSHYLAKHHHFISYCCFTHGLCILFAVGALEICR